MGEFSRSPLSDQEVKTHLMDLVNWSGNSNSISRTFEFSSHPEAMSFMVRLGFEAEKMNHHPELHNVYSRVTVTLNTHDAGSKVTSLDLELARRINNLSWI